MKIRTCLLLALSTMLMEATMAQAQSDRIIPRIAMTYDIVGDGQPLVKWQAKPYVFFSSFSDSPFDSGIGLGVEGQLNSSFLNSFGKLDLLGNKYYYGNFGYSSWGDTTGWSLGWGLAGYRPFNNNWLWNNAKWGTGWGWNWGLSYNHYNAFDKEITQVFDDGFSRWETKVLAMYNDENLLGMDFGLNLCLSPFNGDSWGIDAGYRGTFLQNNYEDKISVMHTLVLGSRIIF